MAQKEIQLGYHNMNIHYNADEKSSLVTDLINADLLKSRANDYKFIEDNIRTKYIFGREPRNITNPLGEDDPIYPNMINLVINYGNSHERKLSTELAKEQKRIPLLLNNERIIRNEIHKFLYRKFIVIEGKQYYKFPPQHENAYCALELENMDALRNIKNQSSISQIDIDYVKRELNRVIAIYNEIDNIRNVETRIIPELDMIFKNYLLPNGTNCYVFDKQRADDRKEFYKFMFYVVLYALTLFYEFGSGNFSSKSLIVLAVITPAVALFDYIMTIYSDSFEYNHCWWKIAHRFGYLPTKSFRNGENRIPLSTIYNNMKCC